MPKDFKASQIRINKLVASGNALAAGQPSLLVYSASAATDWSGSTHAQLLSGVGSDVFLFVSGSKETATQD